MKQLVVYKDRTNVIPVSVGVDLSSDTFSSEIRAGKTNDSELLATWTVEFETDGEDGELILTLDNSLLDDITKTVGYMDIKRITGGEPVPLFDDLIEVVFQNTITV